MDRTKHFVIGAAFIASAWLQPANAKPALVSGQLDGVYISDGTTTVEWTPTDESQEYFHQLTTIATPAPPDFLAGTMYFDEGGSVCTPGTSDLGTCSDGLTLKDNNGFLEVWFASDGASASDQATFMANISNAQTGFFAENGDWENLTGDFTLTRTNVTVYFQSDANDVASDVPEPTTLALFSSALMGLGAMRCRNRNAA